MDSSELSQGNTFVVKPANGTEKPEWKAVDDVIAIAKKVAEAMNTPEHFEPTFKAAVAVYYRAKFSEEYPIRR